MLCEVTNAKTWHIIHGCESKTCLGVTSENMDGANGQTGGKNSSTTFVLTAFISFGLFTIFLDGSQPLTLPIVSYWVRGNVSGHP
jgi:hypothetical protein